MIRNPTVTTENYQTKTKMIVYLNTVEVLEGNVKGYFKYGADS